jgi:hypothetical protein
MSNSLKDLVKEIQHKKKWNIEQVAASIGYSRVHLNRAMNKDGSFEIENLLKSTHADVLQDVTTDVTKDTWKNFSESNRMMAESVLIIAKNNEKLVDTNSFLVKEKFTANAPASSKEVVAPIEPGLRELLLDLGMKSGLWLSRQEGLAALSIKFPVAVSKRKAEHTHPG